MIAIVNVQCVSKKETQSHNKENPTNTQIEFHVPYDPKSLFYQLSGGTTMVLNTVNKDAADGFKVGGTYEVKISNSED